MSSPVRRQASGSDRLILEELFHSLSQPLTTLTCCLAASLKEPLRPRDYRQRIKVALQQAELIRQLVCTIRDLIDAGEMNASSDPL